MATIVTRAGKGAELTSTDYDNTITNLNTETVAATAAIGVLQGQQTAARSVATGGTGATSTAAARTSLGVPFGGTSPNDVTALWRGTQAEYDALPSKVATTIYFVTA
jgi:hypothetical protein